MRGKLKLKCCTFIKLRITPAGAGKTIKIIHFTFNTRDHPRRCGENTVALAGEMVTLGSPPQVRGKPVKARKVKRGTRITPAGAGKTTIQFKGLDNI